MLLFKYHQKWNLHLSEHAWRLLVSFKNIIDNERNPNSYKLLNDETVLLILGRVSNIDHNKIHVGSATRKRELGYRPRSGLWQRKDGRHGRKIRRLPPMRIIPGPPTEKEAVLKLTEVSLTL